MSELVSWSPDIDYDTIWLAVSEITSQISGRGIQQLEEKLADEGLVMTGALKSSLFKEVRQNNTAWVTEMAMQFEMYGRFKDLREMTYKQQAPVDEIAKFVEKGIEGQIPGFTPFKFISGRKKRQFSPGKGRSRPPAGLGHCTVAALPACYSAEGPRMVYPQLHEGDLRRD